MNSHYTFGDSDAAARRLALLAEAYAEPSRAFLSQFRPNKVGLALDLGCGPGHTTRLLHDVLRPTETIGLDLSERYVELARASQLPTGLGFLCRDVLSSWGLPPADLVYARFLLTHLAEPEQALASWLQGVAAGGVLLVQETSLLGSEHPTLTRYYQLVEALQAQHGQSLYVGRDLGRLAEAKGASVEHFAERVFELPAHVMATLHALNLPVWKNDPVARRNFDGRELAEIEQGLLRIAQRAELCAPVRVGLGELVVRAAA